MASSTFPLADVLGWKSQQPLTSPLIVVNDNLNGNGDAISTTFISHCISTGGSVCVIGAARNASHYAQTCKKQGIALDRARRAGLYYHIDCLPSVTAATTASNSMLSTLNTNTPITVATTSAYTLQSFIDRISRAFTHWQSLAVTSLLSAVPLCSTSQSRTNDTTSQDPLLPRFNIVIDDIDAIADIYANGSTSAIMDIVSFLVKMVMIPKNDVSSILMAVDATSGEAIRGNASGQHDGTTGPRGTVLVVCPPDSNDSDVTAGTSSSNSQIPSSLLELLPAPTVPNSALSTTSTQNKLKGGTATTLPQEDQYDTTIRRTSAAASLLLHHPATELYLDLDTLPTGYSPDVHAQLNINRFHYHTGPEGASVKVAAAKSQIVFLAINSDSTIRCHTKG